MIKSCRFVGSLQAKAVSSTREWTEQETLLLLEVSLRRDRNLSDTNAVTLITAVYPVGM